MLGMRRTQEPSTPHPTCTCKHCDAAGPTIAFLTLLLKHAVLCRYQARELWLDLKNPLERMGVRVVAVVHEWTDAEVGKALFVLDTVQLQLCQDKTQNLVALATTSQFQAELLGLGALAPAHCPWKLMTARKPQRLLAMCSGLPYAWFAKLLLQTAGQCLQIKAFEPYWPGPVYLDKDKELFKASKATRVPLALWCCP